jgi:hypothetical protein
MFTEARKIQLIEEVLKTTDESTLSMLETVLKRSSGITKRNSKSAHDFSGIWTKKDAVLIEQAIEDAFEQIHPDDWK